MLAAHAHKCSAWDFNVCSRSDAKAPLVGRSRVPGPVSSGSMYVALSAVTIAVRLLQLALLLMALTISARVQFVGCRSHVSNYLTACEVCLPSDSVRSSCHPDASASHAMLQTHFADWGRRPRLKNVSLSTSYRNVNLGDSGRAGSATSRRKLPLR